MEHEELELPHGIVEKARACLDESIMTYRGEPVGTVAARDDRHEPVNYHHCFVRDFVVSALVFLQEGRPEIVRNFLSLIVELQSRKESLNCFDPGRGLMPASFLVRKDGDREEVVADFGEQAIARVTPIDSAFWWVWLLRTYTRVTGDTSLAEDEETRKAVRLVVEFSLRAQAELLPTILVPDGAFMIDRRMGVYGHPLDVQVLFLGALRSAHELLGPDDPAGRAAAHRLGHVAHHLRTYYWIDLERLNRMNRYPVEEFGVGILNHFNIYPESIPEWLLPWMPDEGGYYAANLGPGRMDFRFMAQGNLLALVFGLAGTAKADAFLDLLGERWDDLVGDMPMKLCWPALKGREWAIITGHDAKNRPWSYHNGGSWPCLLWQLGAAAVGAGRPEMLRHALEMAAPRIADDGWPEYYDTPGGRLVGRQARLQQTWTAAGFLAAWHMLREPGFVAKLGFDAPIDEVECTGPADLSARADPLLEDV